MKKVILLTAMILCFLSCQNEKQYKEDLSNILTNAWLINEVSHTGTNGVASTWYDAIFKYHTDFNSDIQEYVDSVFKKNSQFSDMKNIADSLDIKFKELNNYPKKYKDAYNEIAELIPLVKQNWNYVINPTGSFNSYSAETKELYSNIKNKIEAIRLKYSL